MTFQKWIIVNFDFAPFCFARDPFDNLFDRKGSTMCIVCTNDCSLTSLKHFFNFAQQESVKQIHISCKVTFGLKYITFILQWIAFIFGRDEEEDQLAFSMKERQLSLSSLFKKKNIHNAVRCFSCFNICLKSCWLYRNNLSEFSSCHESSK